MAVANRYKGDCRAGLSGGAIPFSSAFRAVNDASAMSDRAGFEANAGAPITLYYKKITANVAPNKVTLAVYRDNDATPVITFLSAGPEPADGTSFPFYATSDGTATGAPRAGVYRLYMHLVKDNAGGGINNYDVDSDGNFAVLPSLSSGIADSGCLRGNAICTDLVSDAAAYGYGASANMTLTANVTQGNGAAGTNWRLDLTKSDDTQLLAGSNQAASSTSIAQQFTVGKNVQIGANNDGMRLSVVGNATFVPTSGAIQWTKLIASGAHVTQDGAGAVKRSAFMAVDPRITFEHVFQLNDNAFGAPPLSKDEATGRRPSSKIGYLASGCKDALGNRVTDATLRFTEKLWDVGSQLGSEAAPVRSRTSSLTTQGGVPGWADGLLSWTDQLPDGNWTQKEVITAPAAAVGLEAANTRTLILTARNPDYVVIPAGGTNDVTMVGHHFVAGRPFIAGGVLIDYVDETFPAVDSSPAPFCFIGRFNLALGRIEVLNDVAGTPTWQSAAATVGTWTKWPLTQSPADANAWIVTFTGAQTADWGLYSPQVFPVLYSNGTAYGTPTDVLTAGGASDHMAALYGVKLGALFDRR